MKSPLVKTGGLLGLLGVLVSAASASVGDGVEERVGQSGSRGAYITISDGDDFLSEVAAPPPPANELPSAVADPSEAYQWEGYEATEALGGGQLLGLGGASCDTGGCADQCQGYCATQSRAGGCAVYGAFLYLRARDADVGYAVPVEGPIVAPPPNNPIQIGRVGVADPDYQPGYYTGLRFAVDPCSGFDVRYTALESATRDQISTSAPLVIRSLVSHPSSSSAASDFLTATGILDIDFDLLDAGYRRLWSSGCQHTVHYFLGARYAQLEQEFAATFVNTGVETVNTDIDFDGAGVRLGLEAERFAPSGLSIFARGYASFLGGRFQADYLQQQSFDPTVVVAGWESGRVVSILDLELGVAWTSCSGCLRMGAGYVFSGWFNTVKTDDFIEAVQANNLVDVDDSLTFDGFVGHVELRF